MDVDLLRPGTVPISPDTLLWFEFLLDPALLKNHLGKPTSDPTPSELIVKFLTESVAPPKTNDGPLLEADLGNTAEGKAKMNRRGQALKILALKVAAFLKWDLNQLEVKLPLGIQCVLLKDLLLFVDEKHADPNFHGDLDFNKIPAHIIFAISLYHRWVIRSFANNGLNSKQTKTMNGQNQTLPECLTGGEVTEAESEQSICVLQRLVSLKNPRPLVIPSFESLVPLTDESGDVDHRWDLCSTVSVAQFHCQVLMDISNYLIYRESYSNARQSLQGCLREFQSWKQEKSTYHNFSESTTYCSVTQDLISGCCIAIGIKPTHYSPSLLHQFHSSISDQYTNIDKILDKDNILKEIPMLYRDGLELDITSEAASGKLTAHRDGILQIQATNMIRRALEGAAWHKSKVTAVALNKALAPVLAVSSGVEKDRLKYFLLELLALCDSRFMRELSEQPSIQQLLTESEIQDIQETDYTDPIPQALMSDMEGPPPVKNRSAEAASIERQIIASYDPQEIKGFIMKLIATNPNIDISKMNRAWEMPIPIYNMIMGLPQGTAQHYTYVLMAKSFELDHMKNFGMARTMLRVVCDEVSRDCNNSNTVSKLSQLVSWELLLIDIHQFHSEWPAKHMDWSGLSHGCTGVLHKTDGCLPRITLREQCALTLLNMGQWQQLLNLPPYKHSVPIAELYISIAAACLEINKYNKKISTEAWDKLLPIFQNNQKRRDTLTVTTNALCLIVELNALAIVVSLLAKLHNVLSDQPPIDLSVHYTLFWPGSLKNSNQYSIKYVSEMLYEILSHALQLYPNNVAWLKLHGDLHFANNHFSSALKFYLQAAIAGTDYFSRPINKNVVEDHIYKRMIKCCSQLQCHTQAAILCQFLDEVDYTTAFKSLAETSCSDAMDSYYDCIWDVTILEFLINLYSKRGEHYRKQKAVKIIGLLELNTNNNEEIKREAENIRKARFLRALAKQYIC